MRLVGFLQNYNGVSTGFLRNALESMWQVVDEVVVYDDASTEDVRAIYDKFDCTVIYGRKNEFHKELFHKQELLLTALRYQPNWILWFDSDAILGQFWEDRKRTEEALLATEKQGIDLLYLHNLNLWRSQSWYRVDQSFNDLNHGVWWRNTGELHYRPLAGLHREQFPVFFRDGREMTRSVFPIEEGKLLHFGFATDDEIATKYFRYREQGQKDWKLDRLVSESKMVNAQTGEEEKFTLKRAPKKWFPKWYLDQWKHDQSQPRP